MTDPQIVTALDIFAVTGPLAGIIITAMVKYIPSRNGKSNNGGNLSLKSAIDRFVSKDNCSITQAGMNNKFDELKEGQDRLDKGQEKLDRKFDSFAKQVFDRLDNIKMG